MNLSEAEYRDSLINAGLPEPLARILADSGSGAAKGGLYSDSTDMRDLIGRKTTPYIEVIRNALRNR